MSNRLVLMSASKELISRPPSRSVRYAIVLVVLMVAGAIIAAAFYHIDVYATAQGRVQPIGRSKSIQAVEQARIVALGVQEGSRVRRGQVLVALDPVSSIFDESAARLQHRALTAEIARRGAEQKLIVRNAIGAGPIAFPPDTTTDDREREQAVLDQDLRQLRAEGAVAAARIAGNTDREGVLKASLAQKQAMLVTLEEQLANRRQLHAEGWKSGSDVSDIQVEVQKARSDLLSTQQEIVGARSDSYEQRAQLSMTRAKFTKENADQMIQAQSKSDQIGQQFQKDRSHTENLTIHSPVDGTVQALAITNVGQVANVGETLMTIVPNARKVEVEALVSDRDMGFVHIGQDVVVKVRAYPFTRYGVLHGIVSKVARDSIDSREAAEDTDTSTSPKSPDQAPLPHVQDLVYPVLIDITGHDVIDVDGVKTLVRPGMAVEVEIKTASRTVLEYVLSPIRQTISEAGHER